MNLRSTISHNYNEDSSRQSTISNLHKHKQKEEDTSWSDKLTNNSVKTTNKNKQEKKIYSPTDKYNLKIGNYLNHLQHQQGVTINRSKWQHKDPIDSRLSQYTTNLRVTPPSSITTNIPSSPNQCLNIIKTKQKKDHKVVNNLLHNFSNITGLTGLNIEKKP